MAVQARVAPSLSLPSRSGKGKSPAPSLARGVLRSVFTLPKELVE